MFHGNLLYEEVLFIYWQKSAIKEVNDWPSEFQEQKNDLNQHKEIIDTDFQKVKFEEHGNGKIETIKNNKDIDFKEYTGTGTGTYKYPQNCELSKCEYYIHWRPLEDQTKVFFTMFAKNRDFLSIGLSTSDQQIVSKFAIPIKFFWTVPVYTNIWVY